MLTVYKFASAWGQPDLSPFVFKVETYLRMAGIEYRGAAGNPRQAPKGKLPYIDDEDGKRIGDSFFIIEHLKSRYGDKLDASLSTSERAIAAAFRGMLEEQLYFLILYERWQADAGWEAYAPALREYLAGAGVPGLMRGVVLSGVRRKMVRALHAQGMGRHTPAEAGVIGRRIIDAVAETLGERPFFLGRTASSIDATVYPFLTGILDVPVPSSVKEHAQGLPSLRAYCDRMKTTYWSGKTTA